MTAMNGTNANRGGLDRLFSPRSVAIVGASAVRGKAGNTVVRNLVDSGFDGHVWPVNPRGAEIEGLQSFASLDALPGAPDVVFLVVPAEATEQALLDCEKAGAAVAIVGSSGYSELGTDEGRALQDRLLDIARSAGMRLIGPNTNGAISTVNGAVVGFNSRFAEAMNRPGPVSVVSHSGALFDAITLPLQRAGTGLCRFLAAGNEADVTLAETVEWLAEDPHTKVIGLVVEALRDAERFRAAARRAAENGKRIVALKVGRSEAGAAAALAHSSRMAGSARAHMAFFRDSGVTTVTSIEALAGTLSLLALNPDWDGAPEPILCVTTSGAGGALVADAAADLGLALGARSDGGWTDEAGEAIAGLNLPRPIRHPIDLGNLGDWSPLPAVLDALSPFEKGPVVAYSHAAPNETMSGNLLGALKKRRASRDAPVMLLSPGGQPPELEAQYRDAGIPVFANTATVMQCLSAIFSTPKPAPAMPAESGSDPGRRDAVKQGLDRARADGEMTLSEADSTAILSRVGVSMARNRIASSPAEAARFAAELGFPVALKAQIAGIAHKAAAGLVRLGLADAASVETAARAMERSAGDPSIRYLVQPMAKPGIEAMLAVTMDAQLGSFLLFGPGGVDVEGIDATEMLPASAAPDRLHAALAASPLGKLLVRKLGDKAPAALDRIAAALDALSVLASEQGAAIRAAEINPMIVDEDGHCLGVDGLIELSERDTA